MHLGTSGVGCCFLFFVFLLLLPLLVGVYFVLVLLFRTLSPPSLAIIWIGKRELVAFISPSALCLVTVGALWLFLMVS